MAPVSDLISLCELCRIPMYDRLITKNACDTKKVELCSLKCWHKYHMLVATANRMLKKTVEIGKGNEKEKDVSKNA